MVTASRAGARGVFARTHISLLAKCVRRGAEGQNWADSRQTLYLLEALKRQRPKKRRRTSPKLTPREESVVWLVVQGMANREIADELHLSETHNQELHFPHLRQARLSNRVELALYAVARLTLPEEIAS